MKFNKDLGPHLHFSGIQVFNIIVVNTCVKYHEVYDVVLCNDTQVIHEYAHSLVRSKSGSKKDAK